VLVYYLDKKNLITLHFTRQNGKYVKGMDNARFTYKFFDGIQDFDFHLIKGRQTTLKYEAEVEEGKLIIQLGKYISTPDKVVIIDELTSDGAGHYTFTPEKGFYIVRLEGEKTKGSCKIRFE